MKVYDLISSMCLVFIVGFRIEYDKCGDVTNSIVSGFVCSVFIFLILVFEEFVLNKIK